MGDLELRDELPPAAGGPKSTVMELLMEHEGLWVLVNDKTPVASGYMDKQWVREKQDEGWEVEFVVRQRKVWGRMLSPEIPGQGKLEL